MNNQRNKRQPATSASPNRTRPRAVPLRVRYDQLKADFDDLLAYNAALYRQVLALSALAKVKPTNPPTTISTTKQKRKTRNG